MSAWAKVTPRSPCAICGKTDWCSVSADGAFAICRRRDDGTGWLKTDRGGAEYWVYRREGVTPSTSTWTPTALTKSPVINSLALHQIYASLLGALHLNIVDRRALRARGLPNDEINLRQYRSFSRDLARDAIAPAAELFGRALCLAVPGVVADRDGTLMLAAAPGLLVPVRDHRGQIKALKVRKRGSDSPRYAYVSSKHANGPGPGSPVHVALHDERLESTIRVTEGELKADVASVLSGLPTIAIAGVSSWRGIVPVLRAMNTTTCRLALDSDVRTNPHVARALKQMAVHLSDEGFSIELELWDPRFKGIDDALAAGQTPLVLRGEAALAEATRLGEQIDLAGPRAVS